VRFIVEDFGPIKKADVTVKPFTVFIGANGTGKSYLAYLIWCLLSVEPAFKDIVQILEQKELKAENLTVAAKGFLVEICQDLSLLYRGLEEHLENTFRVDELQQLIRSEAPLARFRVSSDDGDIGINFEITDGGLSFTGEELTPEILRRCDFKVERLFDRTSLQMLWDGEVVSTSEINAELIPSIVGFIVPAFAKLIDGYFPLADTFIAPDGRAGLIRAREPIVHQMWTGKLPTLNAADAAFMREIESLEPTIGDKETAGLVEFMEEALGVKFELRRAPPRYTLRMKELEMPVQQSPSGYRELAPLAFILRHWKEISGATMIIEEPEAHLHPDAQSTITRVLAGVSKKCNIVATTHSVYLLDELSNLLRLGRLNEEEKAELGYQGWEGLKPEDVSVYFFSKKGDVEPIEIKEDGISESGLDRVILEIANRHALVTRAFEEVDRG